MDNEISLVVCALMLSGGGQSQRRDTPVKQPHTVSVTGPVHTSEAPETAPCSPQTNAENRAEGISCSVWQDRVFTNRHPTGTLNPLVPAGGTALLQKLTNGRMLACRFIPKADVTRQYNG